MSSLPEGRDPVIGGSLFRNPDHCGFFSQSRNALRDHCTALVKDKCRSYPVLRKRPHDFPAGIAVCLLLPSE